MLVSTLLFDKKEANMRKYTDRRHSKGNFKVGGVRREWANYVYHPIQQFKVLSRKYSCYDQDIVFTKVKTKVKRLKLCFEARKSKSHENQCTVIMRTDHLKVNK